MTRPDGLGSVDPFGPDYCGTGPTTAAQRLEAMVYGEHNCRSDRQFWADLEASMSGEKIVAVAGQQAEAIWNNRYQIGAILAAVMKGMAVAERSARRGNWKGAVAIKVAGAFGKLVAPTAVGFAVEEWLTGVEKVNGDAKKLVYAQEKYAQVVLALALWLGAKLPSLWAREGAVAAEAPRRVVIVPSEEAAVTARELTATGRELTVTGQAAMPPATGKQLTNLVLPVAATNAAFGAGASTAGVTPPAQFPESDSPITSGTGIVRYDPKTHKITLADGRQLDERSTLVMWESDSWQLAAVKHAVAWLVPIGDVGPVGADPRIEVSLDEIRLISTPAGGAPDSIGSEDKGSDRATQATKPALEQADPFAQEWRERPFPERGGFPLRKVSMQREEEKQALLRRIGTAGRNKPISFPSAKFAHPSAVGEVVKFLNDPQRVAGRLLQLQDEVIARYKESNLDWGALVVETLTELETKNGFVHSESVPLHIRLIFGGALSQELAHNPHLYFMYGDKALSSSELVKELSVDGNDAVTSELFFVLHYFPWLTRGYNIQLPVQTWPRPRLTTTSAKSAAKLIARRTPYNIGGHEALLQMSEPVREVFELLRGEYETDEMDKLLGFVPLERIQAVLATWQRKLGGADIPSVEKAVSQITTALQRAEAGIIEEVHIEGAQGYRYRASDPNAKTWYSVPIDGEHVWLYMKEDHFKVLHALLQRRSMTSLEIEDVYRKGWENHHPGQVMPDAYARSILQGINYALDHAAAEPSDSNPGIRVGTIRPFDKVRKGRQDVFVYRLDPPEVSGSSSLQPKRAVPELVERTYTIGNRQASLRLRPLPHKVFERLIQKYNDDFGQGLGSISGFVAIADLEELLRSELPLHPHEAILIEIHNIVSNQLRLVLRSANIGTIKYLTVDNQPGYRFLNSLRVNQAESCSVAIQNRNIHLELRPTDRELFELLLERGSLDSRRIQMHYKADWDSQYPDKDVSDSRVVKGFRERVNYALDRARLHPDGPLVHVGAIVRTQNKNGKAYFYEFKGHADNLR